ncbi:8046_t:CDS:2, partial [Funneliformis geosporum]
MKNLKVSNEQSKKKQVREAEELYKICDNVYCLLAPSIPDDGVSRSGYCGLNALRMVCDSLIAIKIKPSKKENSEPKENINDNSLVMSAAITGKEITDKEPIRVVITKNFAPKNVLIIITLKRKEEERKETEILLQGIKKRILNAYNILQKEVEQEPSVSFFEIFDLSLVMKSKSYQDSKDMELKEKELANELEIYVEQIKKEIKQIRETKLVSDKGDINIPKHSNSS